MLLGDGMPRAYSGDLRVRVIGAVEGGLSARVRIPEEVARESAMMSLTIPI